MRLTSLFVIFQCLAVLVCAVPVSDSAIRVSARALGPSRYRLVPREVIGRKQVTFEQIYNPVSQEYIEQATISLTPLRSDAEGGAKRYKVRDGKRDTFANHIAYIVKEEEAEHFRSKTFSASGPTVLGEQKFTEYGTTRDIKVCFVSSDKVKTDVRGREIGTIA